MNTSGSNSVVESRLPNFRDSHRSTWYQSLTSGKHGPKVVRSVSKWRIWQTLWQTLLLLVLACAPAFAQLPDAPNPKSTHEQAEPFFSKANVWIAGANFGANAANVAYACQLGSHCLKAALTNGGVSGGSFGLSYLLHKTGHYRLERLPHYVSFAYGLGSLVYTATHSETYTHYPAPNLVKAVPR